MTTRIREFLKHRTENGPCLVVDLDVVRENYLNFAKALPDSKVFYAIKANPAPEILKLLAGLGCCFDVASVSETHDALAAGATPDRISYGNTIKKESEIAAAFKLGVTLFAVDCEAEVEKVARAAPGSRVICRIHCDGSGSEWPLSRKFGCEPDYAADILELAHKRGLVPHGISFHVGSQQHNVEAWDRALASTAAIFRSCAERGITLAMVNLGGGFPAKYIRKTPKLESYGKAIFKSLRKHFGNNLPNTIVEPGRGLVGNAGIIEAEVVLIAKRSPEDEVRWVYLDIGKFHGLAETIGEFDPLSDPHREGSRRDGAVHHRRSDLRFRRRAVREDAVSAAGVARHRRQGSDRGRRRLHDDLFVGRLQRLPAAAAIRDLTAPRLKKSKPRASARGVFICVAAALFRLHVPIAARTARRWNHRVVAAAGRRRLHGRIDVRRTNHAGVFVGALI